MHYNVSTTNFNVRSSQSTYKNINLHTNLQSTYNLLVLKATSIVFYTHLTMSY